MSGRSFTTLAFPCSGRNAYWQGPMPPSGIVGNDIRIPTLKKSARAKLGADIHRRSQLPAGFHSPCDMESGGLPSGSSSHWRTKKREDLWRDRFMAYSFPLCAEYRVQRVHLRSEEHTSELQSRLHLVCRLLLEKKKKKTQHDKMLYTSNT